ncbi:MAG: phosphoribosyltransferase family protein [Crocinitomicaceae bacterium]|jgi:pyrimidine operon attenuation protein/uracil phosphoribosyltransferase
MQVILQHAEIHQKITRLAYQLMEQCTDQTHIFIGGIQGNGYTLANELKQIIDANGWLTSTLFEIDLDKEEPWGRPITLSIPEEDLKHGYIILVDDVINSGKTMQYALMNFLKQATNSIKTLVLVDRMHRRFPIKADFVGMSLSTTLKNRVEVDFSANEHLAYLI